MCKKKLSKVITNIHCDYKMQRNEASCFVFSYSFFHLALQAQQFLASLVEKINDLENLTDSTGVSSSELAANLAPALSETTGKIPCGTSSASTLRDIDELRNKAIVHVSSATGAETADVALCNTDELFEKEYASNEEEISKRPHDVHHFAASHRAQGRTTDVEQDFQFKMLKMSAIQQISILTDRKIQTEKKNFDLTESVMHELVKEKEEVVLMNRSGLVPQSFSFSNNGDDRPGTENFCYVSFDKRVFDIYIVPFLLRGNVLIFLER